MKKRIPRVECSLTALAQLEGDEHPRTHSVSFNSLAEGRAWLDRMVAGNDWCQDRPDQLIVSDAGGIRIRSAELNDILHTEPSSINDQYQRWINQFKRGPWEKLPEPKEEPKVPREKLEKAKRPERPKGYITVADIAKELGVKPFDIRQALRSSGAVKPEYGWAFDPKEVKTIKKLMGGK